MKKHAVIVAGGSGTRMGGNLPKQFRRLKGYPVLWWSVKAFHEEDPATGITLVLPEAYIDWWNKFYLSLPPGEQISHRITLGGRTRTESVMHGIEGLEESGLVAIHDGARPMLTPELIKRGWEAAEKHDAAIPVVPVTDSLRKLEGNQASVISSGVNGNLEGIKSRGVDRSEYVAVQTPQVFHTGLLKEAYRQSEGRNFTDDAAVVEAQGHPVALFEGSPTNIKITNPQDLSIARVLKGKDG